MSIVNKTIEYAFPLATASVASNTARDFTATTIFIPETTSRTFRSVILECTAYDNGNAASVTAVLMGISLGAVARSDQTVTQTITNSGENQAFIFTRDVTSYFVTNWTGTSMSAGCRLTISGVATISCTAKLIITYEYDDSVTTQVKTVRIPIEGNTGSLSTTLTAVGGIVSQLPALDTFLPESSKVYRDIFFETYTHTGQAGGTTDRTLNLRFNGTTTLSATYEGGLTSDYPIKRIDKISGSIDMNTAYDIEASTANVDFPFPCLSGMLYVTYEFNASTTTRVLNSLLLPIVDEDGYTPSGSANVERWRKVINMQEPSDPNKIDGSYDVIQSGVMISTIDAGAITFNLGSEYQTTPRVYSHPASVRCGNVFMMRRVDAGGAEDAAYYFTPGINEANFEYYSTGADALGTKGSNTSGLLILNYISGKSTQGIGAHNRTTIWNIRDYQLTTLGVQTIFTASRVPVIPESFYWITCNGFELQLLTTGTAAGSLATTLQAEIVGLEENGPGWFNYYSSFYNSDAEIGPSWMWNTCKKSFKQTQDDFRPFTDHFLVETTNRRYRFDQLTAVAYLQARKYLTYHSISSSFSASVSGFNNASAVAVNFYPNDDLNLKSGYFKSLTPGSLSATGQGSIAHNYNPRAQYIATAAEYSGSTIIKSGISTSQFGDVPFELKLVEETYYAFG